jgi:hypothetical protein
MMQEYWLSDASEYYALRDPLIMEMYTRDS